MTNHKRKLAAAALLASSFLFAGACPASAADAVTPIPAASGSLESLGTPVAGEDSLHDYIQNSSPVTEVCDVDFQQMERLHSLVEAPHICERGRL